MIYGKKYMEIMEMITNQSARELFNNIISEIPLKSDIILIHEAVQKFTGYDYQMVFLNEPNNINVLTSRMTGCDLIVKCDDRYDYDNIEDNDMLVLIGEDRVILFDYEHYVETLRNIKLREKQYENILSFCIEYEVVEENNTFYIKKEFGDERKKLYSVGGL
jgi:hypothetical protein